MNGNLVGHIPEVLMLYSCGSYQGLSLSPSLNYFTHVERGSNLNYAMHSHLQDSIRLLNPIFIISSFIRNGAKLSFAIYIPWFMEK